jgi:hypothetical protein
MKQPKKIKVRVIDAGRVERNHEEMIKFLNPTYKTFGIDCGRKEKWLYGRLLPGRKLRKMPTVIGKCVFWRHDVRFRRDVYYVQETIGGWGQEAAFKGTWYECVEWLDANPWTYPGNWKIVHENEYAMAELTPSSAARS